jgi:glycosyltransferase involved in cell wall biosynthesis
MKQNKFNPTATLVICTYKQATNLRCILNSLAYQTNQNFEVIVTEDGADSETHAVIGEFENSNYPLKHITQEDRGFRRAKALNEAIRLATADYLIFLDGDCVPHPKFIESHVTEAEKDVVCNARRIELGPRTSERLIRDGSFLERLSNLKSYVFLLPKLIADKSKNPEAGIYSRALHSLVKHKPLAIVGSNLSCSKQALYKVNGFNEGYESYGLEDSDLEWRLLRAGYKMKNIKFLAPVYHLYHPRNPSKTEPNRELYTSSKSKDEWFCRKGLIQE